MRLRSFIGAAVIFTFAALAFADEPNSDEEANEKVKLKDATEHMQLLDIRPALGSDVVEMLDHPLLTFGDSARSNANGTLWAWGKKGRPLAVVELYQHTGGADWVHAITLTSTSTVSVKTPTASKWVPEKTQIEPLPVPSAESPAAKEPQRLRQLKELARRFTAHEFWDPDNSRFELRLLVQPVHRYSDPKSDLQDGAMFVLAHGTNPEVLMLIEAAGKSIDEAKWQCSFARLGSAELHVELDGKEVWKQDRTPNVVGKPTDPYWLFLSKAEPREP
jgi:hypothetical protein